MPFSALKFPLFCLNKIVKKIFFNFKWFTSIIFKDIFDFLVSDHFFENYHALRFASRSGDPRRNVNANNTGLHGFDME